jgi:hypothetical protein
VNPEQALRALSLCALRNAHDVAERLVMLDAINVVATAASLPQLATDAQITAQRIRDAEEQQLNFMERLNQTAPSAQP